MLKAILRIFRFARRRIIALSIENARLRARVELYQAIVDADYEKKTLRLEKNINTNMLFLIKKNTIFTLSSGMI